MTIAINSLYYKHVKMKFTNIFALRAINIQHLIKFTARLYTTLPDPKIFDLSDLYFSFSGFHISLLLSLAKFERNLVGLIDPRSLKFQFFFKFEKKYFPNFY